MESLYARQWTRLWQHNNENQRLEIQKCESACIPIWIDTWPDDVIGSLCQGWIYLSWCFCVKVGENFDKHKINIKTGKLCLIQSLCCVDVVNSADRCCMCHITIESCGPIPMWLMVLARCQCYWWWNWPDSQRFEYWQGVSSATRVSAWLYRQPYCPKKIIST
jgi:hypothetical protein